MNFVYIENYKNSVYFLKYVYFQNSPFQLSFKKNRVKIKQLLIPNFFNFLIRIRSVTD